MDVTPNTFVKRCRYFEGTCWLRRNGALRITGKRRPN